MDLIALAGPIFIILIVLEIIFGYISKKSDYYRLNDTIAAISTGILSRTTRLIGLSFGAAVYAFILEAFSIQTWSSDSVLVWILAFISYDFFYYWAHRFGHEINIFWASHAVHHQGEEFNLSTALRQTSTSFLLYWVFFIPWFLMGFPPEIFITVGSVNLIYQFWVHTRHVGKLGFIEWIFITPSNHRVHHAQNSIYIDKNYGGVFIIWDRLFGTYQEELENEAPIYGIRKPLNSWNPFWSNLSVYASLWRDAVATNSIKDKFLIWFKPTGWRPQDVLERYPVEKTDLTNFKKFDTKIELGQAIYCVAQFILVLALSALLLLNATIISISLIWLATVFIWFTMYSISMLLENRRSSVAIEGLRLLLLTIVGFGFTEPMVTVVNQGFLLGYISISVVCLCVIQMKNIFQFKRLNNIEEQV